MKKLDTKELRKKVCEMSKSGIHNLDELKDALVHLHQFVENISHLMKLSREMKLDAEALSAACAIYATKHPKCFGDTAIYDDDGKLKSGDIRLDDCNCDAHYLLSLEDFNRVDGGQITQEFLAGLPSSWTRKRFEIAKSAINSQIEKGNFTESDIAEYKLERKPKHEWSWQLVADAMCSVP